ncbi:MAG: hypothetical protein MZU91_14690 [Desulfosudis oleivorans]|nr:hypothetical protein [Desulfosudis oleivorans]
MRRIMGQQSFSYGRACEAPQQTRTGRMVYGLKAEAAEKPIEQRRPLGVVEVRPGPGELAAVIGRHLDPADVTRPAGEPGLGRNVFI